MKQTPLRLPLSLLLASLSLLGCDEKSPPNKEEAPPAASAPDGSAPVEGTAKGVGTASAASAAPGAVKDKSATSDDSKAPSGPACLAGKWHYNFADDALETMMANLPKAKVTREEGELICENSLSGSEGTVTCSTAGGKPVVIEVAANQAGMPLTLQVKMSGKTSSKFKLVDDKTMQVTSEGIGDLNIEVEAKIAGNKIPFPAKEMLTAFGGEMGATTSFECTGDELRLRPQIDGQTSWQKLRRMK